jgi:L-threonylcarbamoyladenylate synthase
MDAAVRRAAGVLARGGVILYPTDTIYGLGCLSSDERAIARIYSMKKRPENRPTLILVGSEGMVDRFVTEVPPAAATLMKRFWPGPLTLLFAASGNVSRALTAGTGKIGIRLPAHEFCARLSEECGDAIVSTSANISGSPAAAGSAGALRDLAGAVDLVVDAGDLASLPSTVADISGGRAVIVREGAIPRGEIAAALESGS